MASRRRLLERFAFGSHAVHHHRLRRRPVLEVLEGRVVLSTFTVNSLGDAGTGSNGSGDLRYCINQANANNQANTIVFDSTVFGTPQTITLSGGQLELEDNGGTQTITGPAAGVTISGGGNSRVFQVDSDVTASIFGLTVSGGNIIGGNGGGVLNFGTATLSDCTLSSNVAGSAFDGYVSIGGDGGGLQNCGTANLTDCTISGNSVEFGSGGGVFNKGSLTVTDCTISGNSTAGVGIDNSSGNGGALYNSGWADLTACTISGNSANYGGGLQNSGTASLSDCTLSGNDGTSYGGGLENSALATLSDCTISGNDGTSYGGGLENSGTATLSDCTISGNFAGAGAGLADLFHRGAATLTDTIVAGNTNPSGASDIADTENVSGSYNLVGTGGSGGLANGVNGNIVLTSLTGLSLAPLGNYGGQTQTMALLAGSRAIGAGVIADYPGTTTPITTDQRGDPLDSPNPDIGAFQTQGSTLIALTFSGISNQSITAGTSSVTIAGTLKSASQAPVGETVAVTLGGVEQSATIGSGGAFSTTFNTTGLTVAGSPYTVSFAYTSDGTFASASTTSTLTVNPASGLTLTPSSLPIATVGDAYGPVTITATGGSGSYTFALASGSRLPAGLTLSSAGVLSGKPTTTSGSPFGFTITATDKSSSGLTGSQAYTLTVDAAITLSPTTLPVATVADAVNDKLTATGGSGTGYTFALASGSSVPSGLTLSSAGAITGTPTRSGNYAFTIVATDSIGATGSHTYTMTVDPAITISPSKLPAATIGRKYTEKLKGSGGSGAGYSFMASGLPTWLTLSTTGTLGGTPPSNAPSQIAFTVTVTDSKKGTDTMQYTLSIDAWAR